MQQSKTKFDVEEVQQDLPDHTWKENRKIDLFIEVKEETGKPEKQKNLKTGGVIEYRQERKVMVG